MPTQARRTAPAAAPQAPGGDAEVVWSISLVLIDDDRSSREGVAALIRAQPGFLIIAVAAEIQEALQHVRERRPDVVLLNLLREGDDRLSLAGTLHGELPESHVIVMGVSPLREDVAGFVRAGVSGFMMADVSFETFFKTIHLVAAGNQVLPAELTRSLFAQLKSPGTRLHPKRTLDLKRLTGRERSVTELIALGLSNREIAIKLNIAVHTVKGHVHKLLSKLAVNGRLEVAAFARSGALQAGGGDASPTSRLEDSVTRSNRSR